MSSAPVRELAISLPFKIDALGKVGATVDQAKIWADRVRSVIGTAFGQRVYRPQFGCNATLSVYESQDLMKDQIIQDIEFAFREHLPLLTIDDINVEVELETQIINVNITYSTPSGLSYVVALGIASINTDGSVSEEFVWQIQ